MARSGRPLRTPSRSIGGRCTAAFAIVFAACATAGPAPPPPPPEGQAPPLGIAVRGDCFRVLRQSRDADRDDVLVTIPDVTSSVPNTGAVHITIRSPLSADFSVVREDQQLLLSATAPRDIVVKLLAPKAVQSFEVVLRIETNAGVSPKELRRVCPG